jgi:hypothetical protein
LEGHLRFFGGILVATYSFWSENSFNSLPKIVSLTPSPYAQAVSKKLQPNSTESRKASSTSALSEPVQPANPHIP